MKKTFTKLSILILFLALAIDTYSQRDPISFRINVGGNSSYMRNYHEESGVYNTDNMPGFQTSALFDFPFSNSVSLQTGIGIMAKGGKLSFDEGATEAWYKKTIKTSLTYVQLPLYMAYKVPVGEVKVLVFAGPYLELALSGSMKSKYEQLTPTAPSGQFLPEDSTGDFFGGDYTQYHSRKGYGVDFGVGAEYRQFVVNVGYDYGLRDFNVHPTETIHNRSVFMTFGYSFFFY